MMSDGQDKDKSTWATGGGLLLGLGLIITSILSSKKQR